MPALRCSCAPSRDTAANRNGINFNTQFPKTRLHSGAGGKRLAEELLICAVHRGKILQVGKKHTAAHNASSVAATSLDDSFDVLEHLRNLLFDRSRVDGAGGRIGRDLARHKNKVA